MDDCWSVVLGLTESYQVYKSLYLTCKKFYEFFQNEKWVVYRNGLQKSFEDIEELKYKISGCDKIFDSVYDYIKNWPCRSSRLDILQLIIISQYSQNTIILATEEQYAKLIDARKLYWD